MNKTFIALTLALTLSKMAYTDVIYVYGDKNRLKNRPGRTTSIRTGEQNSKDTAGWLQQQNSFSVISSSPDAVVEQPGFRMRGHNQRAISVYFDNIKLHDPLFGISSLPQYDLESLGRVDLYYGTSAADLPEVSATGAIRLESNDLRHSSTRVGSEISSTKSQKIFGLYRKPLDKLSLQVYARDFRSSGNFEYLNNRGTPENPNDDFHAWRDNADSESQLLFSQFTLNLERLILKGVSTASQAKMGLPPLGGLGITTARAKSNASLLYLESSFKNILLSPSIFSYTRHDQHITDDPAQDFLVRTKRVERILEESGIGLNLSTQRKSFGNYIKLESATVQATLANTKYKRSGFRIYSGVDLRPLEIIHLELKASYIDLKNNLPDSKKSLVYRNASAALSLDYLKGRKLYLQAAEKKIPPALIEIFGDGRYVQGNASLNPENYRHFELGHHWTWPRSTLFMAVFADHIKDKITYLPSLPNTVKAQNIEGQVIQGIEIGNSCTLKNLDFKLGYNYLEALDQKKRALPNTPQHQAKLNINYSWQQNAILYHQRMESQSYRDLDKKLLTPALTTADVSFEKLIYIDSYFAKVSISIVNVYNQFRLKSGEKVYPHSQKYGHPLPGRYYKLSFKAGF